MFNILGKQTPILLDRRPIHVIIEVNVNLLSSSTQCGFLAVVNQILPFGPSRIGAKEIASAPTRTIDIVLFVHW